MNTSEAARKWKCSVGTVRKYCIEGMILAAEKKFDISVGLGYPRRSLQTSCNTP